MLLLNPLGSGKPPCCPSRMPELSLHPLILCALQGNAGNLLTGWRWWERRMLCGELSLLQREKLGAGFCEEAVGQQPRSS